MPEREHDEDGDDTVRRGDDDDDDDETIRLEYFAAQDPDRLRARAVTGWWILLALAWAPFACGVISRLAIVRSGSPATIGAHETGSVLLMAAGLVASLVSLIGFMRIRHAVGAFVAGGVVVAQIVMAVCMGLA